MKKEINIKSLLISIIFYATLLINFTNCHAQNDENNNKNKVNSEEFREFLFKFSTDKTYQLNRTKFPFLDCDLVGKCDSITKAKWKHLPLYYDKSEIVSFYDNFERKLKDTDERIYSIEGVENSIAIYYFFKRIDGNWYLIRRESSSE